MDDAGGMLGMATKTFGPGSVTGMEPTVAAGTAPGGVGGDGLAVDLGFLAPSSRSGSLGRVGDYEIVGVLGRGAMGIVLKGLDRELNRAVAVKVQDPSLALNRRARARFLKEARAVAAINHGNVVTIYKVNIVRDRPYLVMEYVPGTLRDRIRGGEPLEVVEVLRIALQVAQGLAAAHEQGVIHRDIKPANILLEYGSQRAKISDFGLALAGLGAEVTVTPGTVVGTPAYMSPEQVRGERMDARSDLFSLGCVIYAMLAGRSPFGAAATADTIRAVCDHHPGPPPEPDHRLARPLNALVMRLLEKDPEARPRTAEDVVAALKALLSEANRAPSASQEVAATASAIPAGPARSGTSSAIAVASLAVAALACLVLWYRPITDGAGGGADPAEVVPLKPPPSASSWTVGRSGKADFPDLKAALARVRPGTRLVLIDAGPYQGPILLDDPERFRGLTIEGRDGTTLLAAKGESVVTIRGVPGVTLRGLAIATRDRQFGVEITGEAGGAAIDRVAMRSPPDSPWTQVYIHEGARGTSERPIVVSNSTFEVGHGGVTIEADAEGAVEFVQVRDNRFSGDDEYVHVLQAARDVTIAGNRFIGGRPVIINLSAGRSERILVVNNTFFRAKIWLFSGDSDPDLEAVVVCNNAILESRANDDPGLLRMARGKWIFHHNLWEAGPEAVEPSEGPLAESRVRLDVLSRDPSQPGFLRPSPDSLLGREGCGGEYPRYVGALPPAGDSPPEPPRSAASPL